MINTFNLRFIIGRRLVVIMHAPWYNTNQGHMWSTEYDTKYSREQFEELFNIHKVNFVFAGHVHAYERFRPTGVNSTCPHNKLNAPTYITIGDGGNHEQLYNSEKLAFFDQLKCSVYRNNEYYGYGLLKIIDRKNARWVWRPDKEGSERVPENDSIESNSNDYVDNVLVPNYAIMTDEEMVGYD
eukprot:Pgem_evm1s12608